MLSGIGGGILFEQRRADFVEFYLDGKTALCVNDFGGDEVCLCPHRFVRDGDEHGIGTQHGNGLRRTGVAGTGFDVHAQGADNFLGLFLLPLLLGFAAAKQCHRRTAMRKRLNRRAQLS